MDVTRTALICFLTSVPFVHLNRGETDWREQIVLGGEVGRRVLTCA